MKLYKLILAAFFCVLLTVVFACGQQEEKAENATNQTMEQTITEKDSESITNSTDHKK